ncbi:MAG: hypothetical protein A2Y34_16730 [Spirochaetes bacterium GWC1_27_15]|nr:MAG: hypothetical protein A2Z98_12245 [Spirochaetes bacterium GWB1_27_13]OHD20978.1 MAG: hypothetical protein A2Y34_16730 [Spirochaetes bacterium GWC1_27_15]
MELSKNEYPFYKPILKDLFEWIQDINWPVARYIVPLLIKSGKDVLPIVKEILDSTDDVWKYWTLTCVISEMPPDILKGLEPDLLRIKNNPTTSEIMEELPQIALELLEKI